MESERLAVACIALPINHSYTNAGQLTQSQRWRLHGIDETLLVRSRCLPKTAMISMQLFWLGRPAGIELFAPLDCCRGSLLRNNVSPLLISANWEEAFSLLSSECGKEVNKETESPICLALFTTESFA